MLDTAPIELGNDWGTMIPDAALRVIESMRRACLEGVELHSDSQPNRLRVDLHGSGPPAIWLHQQPVDLAWIFVNIGPRDWSKLAYQFGHELGHVAANSWRGAAKPAAPCQWLEEALVEAFSLRGLARLADEWSRTPPFAEDSGFGASLAVYRQNIIESYGKLAKSQGNVGNFGAWFKSLRSTIEDEPFLSNYAKTASLTMLSVYEAEPESIAGLSALNRWPGRASVSLPVYLNKWEASCKALGVSAKLPVHVRELLGPI